MTSAQRRTLVVFAGIMGVMFVAIPAGTIAWDFRLDAEAPDGLNTISWVLALVGFDHPAVAFLIGIFLGNFNGLFLVGLPLFHLWFGMPSPALYDELVALRAEVARLKTTNPPAQG